MKEDDVNVKVAMIIIVLVIGIILISNHHRGLMAVIFLSAVYISTSICHCKDGKK